MARFELREPIDPTRPETGLVVSKHNTAAATLRAWKRGFAGARNGKGSWSEKLWSKLYCFETATSEVILWSWIEEGREGAEA